MNNGICFYEKSKMDLDLGTAITVAVSDSTATDTGSTYTDLMRNRRNDSGWATTGSNDAANTTLTITALDAFDIDTIFLILHNLKAYTLKYWNGSAWTDFSTPVNVSNNSDTTSRHTFTQVSTTSIQLVITGTMVANADKFIAQMVLTQLIGQLTTGMSISNSTTSQVRRVTQMISGKYKVARNLGGFSCTIQKNNMTDDTDLTLLETLYQKPRGFLVWLNGGSSTQFKTLRIGYRPQDLYLMDFKNEYTNQFDKGNYNFGTNINAQLVEIA
jgi:hypothetical protein